MYLFVHVGHVECQVLIVGEGHIEYGTLGSGRIALGGLDLYNVSAPFSEYSAGGGGCQIGG